MCAPLAASEQLTQLGRTGSLHPLHFGRALIAEADRPANLVAHRRIVRRMTVAALILAAVGILVPAASAG
jgi:hypothetical protein